MLCSGTLTQCDAVKLPLVTSINRSDYQKGLWPLAVITCINAEVEVAKKIYNQATSLTQAYEIHSFLIETSLSESKEFRGFVVENNSTEIMAMEMEFPLTLGEIKLAFQATLLTTYIYKTLFSC